MRWIICKFIPLGIGFALIISCAGLASKSDSSTLGFVTVKNPSFDASRVSGDVYTAPKGNLNPRTGVPGWEFNPSEGESYSGLVTESGTNEMMSAPKFIPHGWQAAFIQGTGWFSQTVKIDAGGSYVIRFRAAGRSKSGNGSEGISIKMDGKQLGIFTPVTNQWSLFPVIPYSKMPACGGHSTVVSQWTSFSTDTFVATAGKHVVAIVGIVPDSRLDGVVFIDDIQIATPEQAAQADLPVSPVYDVVFVGDSITAGALTPDFVTEAPSACCAQILGERYNVAVRMVNRGYSGSTTVDWFPSSKSSSPFQTALAAAALMETNQPGKLIFSIMLGVNDSAQHGPSGSPVSPSDYHHNLQTIIDQFLINYPDAYIIVNYPTYYSPNTQNYSLYGPTGLALVKLYLRELDQLIADNISIHPGHVFAGDKSAFGYFSTNYLSEMAPESGPQGRFYLHPNRAGAAKLGNLWADAIARIMHLD